MTIGTASAESKPSVDSNTRNALITRIALFLNYMSKENLENLTRDMGKNDDPARVDVFKIMRTKGYVSPRDITFLKKACLNFAKAHTDTRFGILCIEFGFLTRSNLDLALEEQSRLASAGESIMLGDLLVDAGMLSDRQRSLVLQKQKLDTNWRRNSDNHPKDVQSSNEAVEPEETPELDVSSMREIRDPQLVILIRNDALKAYLLKNSIFDPGMPLDDLKDLLEKNGIIYGLVDDGEMENFIANPRYQKTPFEAASGLPPIEGTDARLIYMFEQDYLKAGTFAEDGTIDFKDRGEIPFVKSGDVIAEKIPPKDGKDGINIYGDVIPKTEAMDIPFNLGKNVCLSRDEMKVIAETEGNPKVKPGGEISVNDAYFIDGDVDYTTGHIKFDKNVFITGTIKSGFRVEAIDVIADTADGGIIKAEGNVYIRNGVTESSIQAKGNITAGFIHRSDASCMGDLDVGKEIADTNIIIEGTFSMPRGRMFSSSVCAKGGVKVYNIGSEKAAPSTITVGTSMYFEKELQHIDAQIERNQNLLEAQTLEKNKFESELDEISEKLDNHEKSRQRTLAMIEQMGKTPEKGNGNAELFKKSLDEAEMKIHALKDRQALLVTQLKRTTQTIERCTEKAKVCIKEKFNLKRLNQKNPPKPIVDVGGKILSGSRIYGRHAHLILNHPLARARIMEMHYEGETNSKRGWEMVVTNI